MLEWEPMEMRYKELKSLLDEWAGCLSDQVPEKFKIKEVCYWPQGIRYKLLNDQAQKLGPKDRALFCNGSQWAQHKMERQLNIPELMAFRSCMVNSFLTDSFFYIEA